MLHILLAFYIICFSLGVVIIILSFLGYARSGHAIFAHSGILFCAVLLLMVRNSFRTYEEITPELVFGNTLSPMTVVLTIVGRGLLAFMICLVACEVVALSISALRNAFHVGLAVAAAAAGGASGLLSRPLLSSLTELVLAVVQVYAIIVVLVNFRRISNPLLRSAVQIGLLLAAIMLMMTALLMIAEAERISLKFLLDFPVAELFLFLASLGLFIHYALRSLSQAQRLSSFQMPEEVARKYSISPREREIISMIVQGYPNRAIGEKLFISSTTVKNHIYHIYQKTGVANKIQLINLMNSPK